MTTLVSVLCTAAVTVNVDAESIEYHVPKVLTPHPDADGTNCWQEDNRYIQEWTITGTVNCADKEKLVTSVQTVTDTVNSYPRLRVYDKSANPFYNDYSPVRFKDLRTFRLGDDLYRVTMLFQK